LGLLIWRTDLRTAFHVCHNNLRLLAESKPDLTKQLGSGEILAALGGAASPDAVPPGSSGIDCGLSKATIILPP
jgi:hypothetical protein